MAYLINLLYLSYVHRSDDGYNGLYLSLTLTIYTFHLVQATCEELWCHNGQSDSESDNCSTLHMPWADGTPCGHGKWCQKRNCVWKDRKSLQPVNGGWGKWQK